MNDATELLELVAEYVAEVQRVQTAADYRVGVGHDRRPEIAAAVARLLPTLAVPD